VDEIEHGILQHVEWEPGDARNIRISHNRRSGLSPYEIPSLTIGQVETALEQLLAFGFVKYEQRPDARLWSITAAGQDALYDWNPWRFRVDTLVPAAKARLDHPGWQWWEGQDAGAIVAVGQFLGQSRPSNSYQHDAFEVENDGRRGWVVDRLYDDPERRLGAMTLDIDISLGDILVRKSPPPGEPRPEPIRLG
jgi:hypothetical protein